jgi:hypothetical protein
METLVHEVPDDERKAFVRAYVERAMQRLRKPRRSKNPLKGAINETIRDVLANTDSGRLHLVAEANFQWQKKQLRRHFDDRTFTYRELRQFIHDHGWDELWIPTKRLQGYWLSICRTGRM